MKNQTFKYKWLILFVLMFSSTFVMPLQSIWAQSSARAESALVTTYKSNPINEPTAIGKAMLMLGRLMGFHPNREVLKFFENHPQHLYRVVDVTRLSLRIAQALCGSEDPRGEGDGTIDNAVLHFVWSFFLTGTLGPEDARALLWAHELNAQLSPATSMDLQNNQLGIDFAKYFGVEKVREIYFQNRWQDFARKFEPVREQISTLIQNNKFVVLKAGPSTSTCLK